MSNDIQEALGADFNPDDYNNQPDNDFTPLTPGWYPAEFERAETCQTKDERGSYLKLQLVILGEKYSGRKVFDNINLKNDSAKCVGMGIAQLTKIAKVYGKTIMDIKVEHMLGQMIQIKTAVRAAKGDYPADTEIKDYKAPGAATTKPRPAQDKPPVAETVASAPKQEVTGGPGKMPWE